jgi:MFS family permease
LHTPPGSATSTPSISCEPLLGAAEAGFFPGIIFYLTLWFPTEYRARIAGYFTAAIPLSTVIGAPISGLLLFSMVGSALPVGSGFSSSRPSPPSFSPASSSSI